MGTQGHTRVYRGIQGLKWVHNGTQGYSKVMIFGYSVDWMGVQGHY